MTVADDHNEALSRKVFKKVALPDERSQKVSAGPKSKT